MRLHLAIAPIVFVAAFMLSCNRNPRPISIALNTKDSLLSNFFKVVDTLPFYDTTNTNYKILIAYKNNDTLALASIIDHLQARSIKPWMNYYLKPCANSREFDTLKGDEAYRFFYESYFCEYFTMATIVQTGKKVKASATVYRNASRLESTPCTIVQQSEVTVDSLTWDRFQEAILIADFWGLKEDNDYYGADGDELAVLGYQKPSRRVGERRRYVSRWSRSMDRLREPFLLILRLCKIDKGCILYG